MYEVQKLNPRHYQILDLFLAGLQKVQIAERLNMSPMQISIITNSPTFQHELAIRRARIDELSDIKLASSNNEVSSTLKEATLKAAKKLIEKMDTGDDNMEFKASCEVLDRGGFPKATRLESNQPLAPIIVLTAEQVGCLADALNDLPETIDPTEPAKQAVPSDPTSPAVESDNQEAKTGENK